MSLNYSKASSFDPYAYYKKLTDCIAKKNNLKVNLKNIPGIQKVNNASKGPLITKEHLTAKFLAKYNNRKQEEETEKNQQMIQSNKYGLNRGNPDKNLKKFVVKFPLDAGKCKKKKEQPCFINLPDSFFRSFNGPDLSLFKVPEVPRAKKAKLPDTTPDIESGPDFTMDTINSASFKPPKASTPLDKARPMTSDPNEIHGFSHQQEFFSLASMASAPSFDIKAKKFMDVVNRAAIKLDSSGFANIPDPLISIHNRIEEIYQHSSQSPRDMHETLMSENESKPGEMSEPSPPRYKLPIPKFYNEPENKAVVPPRRGKICDNGDSPRHDEFCDELEDEPKFFKEILSPTRSDTSQICDLFNWTTVQNKTLDEFSKLFEETPAARTTFPMEVDDQMNSFSLKKSSIVFDAPTETTLFRTLEDPFLNTPQHTLPQAAKIDDSIFEFSFANNFTMDCDFPNLDCLDTQNFETFAVFASPPDTYRRKSQTQSPSDKHHRRSQSQSKISQKHSQRSQKEKSFEEAVSNNVNSSLSTYKWTPNISNVSLMNESISSSRYPFEPRNILKNSFELF